MVSLLVEAVVGALIVVSGWYFLSGGTLGSLTGSAVASSKRNKRKKKSKPASKVYDKHAAKEPAGDTEPAKKAIDNRVSLKGRTTAGDKPQKLNREPTTAPNPRRDLDTAEFPALSFTDAKESMSAPPKPATSYAATAKQSVSASKPQQNGKAKPQKMTPLLITEEEDLSSDSDVAAAAPAQIMSVKAALKLDNEQEDDDWHVVKPAGAATIRISSSRASTNAAVSQAVPKSIPGLTERSKKQRQNDAKRAAEKVEREEAEKQRLQLLAQHRKQQEREKVKLATPVGRSNKPQQSNGQRQTLSGGMTAKVTQSGLIWE